MATSLIAARVAIQSKGRRVEVFGYKIFKRNRPDTVFFDKARPLHAIFGDNGKLCIFDVGANIGQSHRFFRELFSDSKIFCFEPVAATYDKLCRSLENDSMAKAYRLAMGAQDGELEMFTYVHSDENSVFRLNQDALSLKNKLHQSVPEIFEHPITKQTVPMSRIDSFAVNAGIDKIDILKIDVQCYEDEVLRGAKEFLSSQNIGVVTLEIIFDDIYNRPLSFGLIESLLAPYGYILWDISHIYKDLKVGRTCFVDALYISTKLFEEKKQKLYSAEGQGN